MIGDYDAIVIRSATKLTADLIERADRLKVIGRAGVGVDNVDVDAATQPRDRRRERARLDGRLRRRADDRPARRARAQHPAGARGAEAGRWERSRWGGIELAGKTLGVLGFGRIGQQVARRALGLGMRVVALRPVRRRRPLPRGRGSSALRRLDDVLAAARLRHAAPAADRRDARDDRRATRSRRCGTARASSTPPAARSSTRTRSSRRSARASSPAPRSTSSPRSRTPARCSSSTRSSSRRTSPRPPTRRRTGRA